MTRSTATAAASGTRRDRPRARLDAPTAVTNRISSVAYAVDEMASDENTASAITLGMRWCSCSAVANGRPTRTRLNDVSKWSAPDAMDERRALDSARDQSRFQFCEDWVPTGGPRSCSSDAARARGPPPCDPISNGDWCPLRGSAMVATPRAQDPSDRPLRGPHSSEVSVRGVAAYWLAGDAGEARRLTRGTLGAPSRMVAARWCRGMAATRQAAIATRRTRVVPITLGDDNPRFGFARASGGQTPTGAPKTGEGSAASASPAGSPSM